MTLVVKSFHEYLFVFTHKILTRPQKGILNMDFKSRLKERRRILRLSQRELAQKAGVTDRTVQNYELGTRLPQNIDIVSKLALALDTTVEYLLGSEGMYVLDGGMRGGARAARDIHALVSEISGLFAGGEIDEAEKDGIMAALNEAYWLSKEKNRKYTPNKFKKTEN